MYMCMNTEMSINSIATVVPSALLVKISQKFINLLGPKWTVDGTCVGPNLV